MLVVTMDSVSTDKANEWLGAPTSSRRATVLIVDDNDDNLLLLSYALEEIGYATIQGSCGSDAIELATRHVPDLVLLDILLPDMNGMTVIRHLRRRPQMRQVPIIAVTALARPSERSKIIAAGFTAYISKPYMLDELYALISSYLTT